MKGRKSFNFFPPSFLVLSRRYFSVINNDFSVFYSAFSFLPWKSTVQGCTTQSINNQPVRYTFKTKHRPIQKDILAFSKGETKDFLLSLSSDNSSSSSPSFLLHDFKYLRSRAHVFFKFFDRFESRECHNARDFHSLSRVSKGQQRRKRLIESRVMNGEMIDDRRIPEWKHLDALDKAPTPSTRQKLTLVRPDVWTQPTAIITVASIPATGSDFFRLSVSSLKLNGIRFGRVRGSVSRES